MKRLLAFIICLTIGLCFVADGQSIPVKTQPADGKTTESWPPGWPKDQANDAGSDTPFTGLPVKKPSPLAPVGEAAKKAVATGSGAQSVRSQGGCTSSTPHAQALSEAKRLHAVWVSLDKTIPTAIPANATAGEYSRLRALIGQAIAIKKDELVCYRQYDSAYANDWRAVIQRAGEFDKETGARKDAADRMLQTEKSELDDVDQRLAALNDDASDDAARLRKIRDLKAQNVEELTRIIRESGGSGSVLKDTVKWGDRMIAILNADLGATAIDEDLYTSVYTGLTIVIDNYVARQKPEPDPRDRGWRR